MSQDRTARRHDSSVSTMPHNLAVPDSSHDRAGCVSSWLICGAKTVQRFDVRSAAYDIVFGTDHIEYIILQILPDILTD